MPAKVSKSKLGVKNKFYLPLSENTYLVVYTNYIYLTARVKCREISSLELMRKLTNHVKWERIGALVL